MTVRLDVDHVPEARRPPEVAELVNEARELRDRLRSASEQLAKTQAALEQAESDDAAAASERIRQGGALGAEAPAVGKARKLVNEARRNERALELANGAALVDLASAIRAHSDGWLANLDAELDERRAHALDALAAFEAAVADMRSTASSALWIRGALDGGRFDRPARQPLLGSAAPSSARRTVNAEAMTAGELVGYLRELVEPAPVAIVEPATSDT
jgi:hypothetical protein